MSLVCFPPRACRFGSPGRNNLSDQPGRTAVRSAALGCGGIVQANPLPFLTENILLSEPYIFDTLAGPRGGLILAKGGSEELYKKLNSAVFPGGQGGPLMHVIAGKAVALKEAMEPEFKTYQQQVAKNAKAMVEVFLERGYKVVSGGTDNHLFLVDLVDKNLTGKEADAALGRANITVNKNAIPNDPEKPFVTSGIRVGTPAATSRGFKEEDMAVIARLMWQTATGFETKADEIRTEVARLTAKYPLYE